MWRRKNVCLLRNGFKTYRPNYLKRGTGLLSWSVSPDSESHISCFCIMLRAEMWKKQFQVIARENAEMAKTLRKQSRKLSIANVKLKRFQEKRVSLQKHKRMRNESEEKRLLVERQLCEQGTQLLTLQDRFTLSSFCYITRVLYLNMHHMVIHGLHSR